MPIRQLEVIGWAKEVTYGTFVAPANFVPGKGSVGSNNTAARPAQSRGTRGQVIDGIVDHQTGCTVSAELIPEVLSGLVAQWCGTGSDSISGSAGVGYTHALTPKNALTGLSFEFDEDVVSQVLARQVAGNYVDQITIKGTNNAFATFEVQTIGQREITPATPGQPSNPTPSISTLQPFDFSLLSATYNSVATTQLQDLTLTLMNHVARVDSNNGQLYVARLAPTQREVGFGVTADFLDTTFYNDWNSKTRRAWTFAFTSLANISGASAPYLWSFTIPQALPNGNFQLGDANDVINQQLQYSCTVSGANEFSASLKTSESAALS